MVTPDWQRMIADLSNGDAMPIKRTLIGEQAEIQQEDDELARLAAFVARDAVPKKRRATHEDAPMNATDRHIEGIEKKLDARMEAMQRFNEQADERNRDLIARMERQAEQAEGRMSQDFQKLDDRVDALHADNKSLRKHVWGAVLTTVLGFAGIVALMQTSMDNTISEQGAWIRQNVDRADQERSDTSSALQSIQATQQSIQETQAAILDRLPPRQPEPEAQPETAQPSS
ncbi:hypothetical protein FIU88_08115 [Halomonas sp. THAF12]|nr:hypothetical protein FIU88_08115 [Halomonas sp. THAF12]